MDITYQASAPSAGGLVNSRDFVNLRSWHIMRDGKITTMAEPKLPSGRSQSTSSNSSIQSFSRKNLRKSFSSTAIWDDGNDSVDEVVPATAPAKAHFPPRPTNSLSRSMGAQSFADRTPSDDEQADRKDSDNGATGSSASVEKPPLDTPNFLYLTSAVAVEYALMPPLPKYTR